MKTVFTNCFAIYLTKQFFFNVVQDEITVEKLMLKHQDSISKTQMQVKKQRTSKGERHISKYNNYS